MIHKLKYLLCSVDVKSFDDISGWVKEKNTDSAVSMTPQSWTSGWGARGGGLVEGVGEKGRVGDGGGWWAMVGDGGGEGMQAQILQSTFYGEFS